MKFVLACASAKDVARGQVGIQLAVGPAREPPVVCTLAIVSALSAPRDIAINAQAHVGGQFLDGEGIHDPVHHVLEVEADLRAII